MPTATKKKPERPVVGGKAANKPKVPWQPLFLVHIYRYARSGMSDDATARALGVNTSTMKLWKATKPEVKEAFEIARSESNTRRPFGEYMYTRMDPQLKDLWDNIREWETLPSGAAKIEALLSGHGTHVRQQLFLQALIHHHFSTTRALETLGMDRRLLNKWVEDPNFALLVDFVQDAKGDYFEESLVRKCEEGDVSAIIFANKTFNRGRGYGTQVDVKVSGSIRHTASELDLDELDLSPECRRELTQKVRELELKQEEARRWVPPDVRLIEAVSDDIARAAEIPENQSEPDG